MKRNRGSFNITGHFAIKEQLLNWVNQYSSCSFLDSHQYECSHKSEECIAAAGSLQSFTGSGALTAIDSFYNNNPDWLFGHLCYDDQNNPIGFNPVHFFQPETVLRLSGNELVIETVNSAQSVFQEILKTTALKEHPSIAVPVIPKISKKEYIEIITQLLKHIQRGDCYEINFCQEFFSENAPINPLRLYQELSKISPNPFSAYYKQAESHLLCASPERFLQRKANQLISQPIKGTCKRDIADPGSDALLKKKLRESSKERSENVMVVDLVRNDLSKICKEGSVVVEELFGIYTFPQVHQMISTITGTLKENTPFSEIIHATFPMGSMTGAPKKRVMDLISQYEISPRGLFSGAVGYISPQQEFDFNVVIRSLLYNSSTQYLSYMAGSGITFYSNPEDEYEECLLKVKAIETLLSH